MRPDIISKTLISVLPYIRSAEVVFTGKKEIILYCTPVTGDVEGFWKDPKAVLPAFIEERWIERNDYEKTYRLKLGDSQLVINLPFSQIFGEDAPLKPCSIRACFDELSCADDQDQLKASIETRVSAMLSNLSTPWSMVGVTFETIEFDD